MHMKKSLALLLFTLTAFIGFAQSPVKPAHIGFSFGFNDFVTPQQIKTTTFKQTIKSGDWGRVSQRMNTAFSVYYWKGLTQNLDVSGTYTGSFLRKLPATFPAPSANYFHSLDLSFHAKLLKETAVINPFATLGIGVNNYKTSWNAQIPMGFGLQINPFDNQALILIQAEHKGQVNQIQTNHLLYSAGVNIPLSRPKEVAKFIPPPPPPAPADTDGDGVIDTEDACPTIAGLPALKGCPDKDGDAIADKDDKCPDVAGLAKYGGCPIPDTDGDGINDETDKCPKVAGLARYGGCPVPDTDGDGVNDEADKCPNVAGPADNNGCPRLEQYNFNSKNVQFANGSASLLPKATVELDKLVTILNEHPEIKVSIDGYTDITGKPATNLALSEKRANAAKAYLVKKGIADSRLSAAGHGIENPIADNKTAAGRAENRRVEFKAMQ